MKEPTYFVGMFALTFLMVLGVIFYFRIRSQGMTITSWWRSPWHNAEVGGVKNSLHMIGLAWDIIPASAYNAAKLRSMGLRVIDEYDHLHAQIV